MHKDLSTTMTKNENVITTILFYNILYNSNNQYTNLHN